jgi:hypothetical protein
VTIPPGHYLIRPTGGMYFTVTCPDGTVLENILMEGLGPLLYFRERGRKRALAAHSSCEHTDTPEPDQGT